jgi:hypothetical protein
MTRADNRTSTVTIKKIDDDVFVYLDEIALAKLGKDGTPEADRWVMLEPGFIVADSADHTKLVIEYEGRVIVLPWEEAVQRSRDG